MGCLGAESPRKLRCVLNDGIPALRCTVVVAALLIAFAPGIAHAGQSTSATLHVRLVGPAGLATSVDVSGGDPPRRWSTPIASGQVSTLRRLPPATYTVTVPAPNSAASAAIEVALAAGTIVWLEATVGQPPAVPRLIIVDRSQFSHGTSFSAKQLEGLPSSGSLWAFIDTAAPLVAADRIDNGGLGTATSPRMDMRGASWTTTSLSIGGLDAGTPTTSGAFALYPDLSAAAAVTVSSGLMPPDMAASGVAIALVPKRPGTRLRTALDVSFTTPGMVSTSSADPGLTPIAAVNDWANVNVQVGGPVRKTTGVLVSVSASRASLTERGDEPPVEADATSVFTHVVSRPGDRDEVRVLGAIQWLAHAFDGRAQFADRSATETNTFGQGEVAWDHVSPDGSQRELSFGVQRGTFTPVPGSTVGGTVDRIYDGVIPPMASHAVRSRWDARLELNPGVSRRLGDLRVVMAAARTSQSSEVLALPAVAELVAGFPARVWIPEAPISNSDRRVTEASAAIQSSMPLANRFTLDLGLRAEISTGKAAGAAAGISWGTLSPRVFFRWAPKAVTIFGGFSRYQPRLSPDLLAFGDPGEPVVNVHRWLDPNDNGRLDTGETGTLVALAGRGPAIAGIDPNLKPPRVDEYALSAEHRFSHTFVRVSAVVRRSRNIPRSVDVGVPTSGYAVVLVPDGDTTQGSAGLLTVYDRLPSTFGQDRYLLTNMPNDQAAYDGLEVDWGLETPRWYSMAGIAAYRSNGSGGNRGFHANENDQGVIGELFEDPNATTFSSGRLFFDRAYVLNWSTSYRTRNDFLAGVTARYQDGQPFSRLVLVPDLAQGPEAISADELGTTRFTFAATLDTRFEKGFAVKRGRAAFRVDVFNLLNRGNEVEEDPIAGPGFRRITAVQPPRTLRIGVRFEY